MGKIGYWSKNERLGDDAWVNTSSGAHYKQVNVLKHPHKKEYAVSVWGGSQQRYLMNVNSGTTAWYGMTQKKAFILARKFMRLHPNG